MMQLTSLHTFLINASWPLLLAHYAYKTHNSRPTICSLKSTELFSGMAFRQLRHLQPVFKRCTYQPLSTYQPQPEVIQVTPKVSRFDQKVHIKVQGLPKQTKVTLHACTEHVWQRTLSRHVSCGHYVSSSAGDVDLQRDASMGGTYTGVEPMGLFLSMRPCPSGLANIRMVIKNVELPILYRISVYLGHLALNDLHADNVHHDPFSTLTVERVVMPANVKKISVKEGGVRGTLFLPPGDGPFPGVIDMYGLSGGLIELRAALLAANGFASLALPYFRYDDLPDSLFDQTNFDYFENAVEWFSSHRSVLPGGIGIVSLSAGASYGLMMAWKCPQVKAYVRINAPGLHTVTDLNSKGTFLKAGLTLDNNQCPVTEEGWDLSNGWILFDHGIIPLWEKDVHMLTLVSGDDGLMAPWFGSMHYNLYPEDRRHLIEVVHYPGAGHLIEPPYLPHCRCCHNAFVDECMLWGGRTNEHAVAQEDAWQRIIKFFRKHLR